MTTAQPIRVGPKEVREKLGRGDSILFVCIYPTDVYNKSHLEGAISLEDFESRLSGLSRGAEIVFY